MSLDLCLVWLKRDLRLTDHLPLLNALDAARQESCPTVLLYLIEPDLLSLPDSAAQHHAFAMECLQELAESAAELNLSLLLVKGRAVDVFGKLAESGLKASVYSHQETGNLASFERDKQSAQIFKKFGWQWHQVQSNGVVRGRLNRDKWSSLWHKAMDRPIHPLPSVGRHFDLVKLPELQKALQGFDWTDLANSLRIPDWASSASLYPASNRDKPDRQRGGRKTAEACLSAFLSTRGKDYRSEMSSPLSAESACSRVSPYLTFGVFSVREVLTALDQKRIALNSPDSGLSREAQSAWRKSLKSFESRLHWHCHFIQKFESEPELELRAPHRHLNRMRLGDLEEGEQARRLLAWITGQTGVPMIDACMRMLRATGWVNFRMRAMLVAFASYQLWLDWRLTAPLLAREFLDYEPGIHYPQFQMQSGVTGINTLRIYSPVKQARDHDPEGVFIKRWIPELSALPAHWLAEPWNMPRLEAEALGFELGRDYPNPIVDPVLSVREARERIALFRKQSGFQDEANRVYQKHGSRHPNRNGDLNQKKTLKKKGAEEDAGVGQKPDQLSLFD